MIAFAGNACLSDRNRPARLSEIVGQPRPVATLSTLLKRPFASCWLLRGEPGTGKTSAALAFAAELGCIDEFHGLTYVNCTDLKMDRVQSIFGGLGLRPMMGPGWQVLVIEEMERLTPSVQPYLKTALETLLPRHAIVIATSNDTSAIQAAVLDRFRVLEFESGESFATAALERLCDVWCEEAGASAPMPGDMARLGWSDGRFSLRAAYNDMEVHLMAHET